MNTNSTRLYHRITYSSLLKFQKFPELSREHLLKHRFRYAKIKFRREMTIYPALKIFALVRSGITTFFFLSIYSTFA